MAAIFQQRQKTPSKFEQICSGLVSQESDSLDLQTAFWSSAPVSRALAHIFNLPVQICMLSEDGLSLSLSRHDPPPAGDSSRFAAWWTRNPRPLCLVCVRQGDSSTTWKPVDMNTAEDHAALDSLLQLSEDRPTWQNVRSDSDSCAKDADSEAEHHASTLSAGIRTEKHDDLDWRHYGHVSITGKYVGSPVFKFCAAPVFDQLLQQFQFMHECIWVCPEDLADHIMYAAANGNFHAKSRFFGQGPLTLDALDVSLESIWYKKFFSLWNPDRRRYCVMTAGWNSHFRFPHFSTLIVCNQDRMCDVLQAPPDGHAGATPAAGQRFISSSTGMDFCFCLMDSLSVSVPATVPTANRTTIFPDRCNSGLLLKDRYAALVRTLTAFLAMQHNHASSPSCSQHTGLHACNTELLQSVLDRHTFVLRCHQQDPTNNNCAFHAIQQQKTACTTICEQHLCTAAPAGSVGATWPFVRTPTDFSSLACGGARQVPTWQVCDDQYGASEAVTASMRTATATALYALLSQQEGNSNVGSVSNDGFRGQSQHQTQASRTNDPVARKGKRLSARSSFGGTHIEGCETHDLHTAVTVKVEPGL